MATIRNWKRFRDGNASTDFLCLAHARPGWSNAGANPSIAVPHPPPHAGRRIGVWRVITIVAVRIVGSCQRAADDGTGRNPAARPESSHLYCLPRAIVSPAVSYGGATGLFIAGLDCQPVVFSSTSKLCHNGWH